MSKPKYKPSAEHRYFLYDPDGDGLLFFATEKDRDYAARECISEYADSDGWGESVTDVFVGTVTGVTKAINLQKRPPDDALDEDGYDGEGTDWSHGYDEICSYAVLPLGGSLEAQRDRAHDCIQDLLDYINMIAPEASAEEIDEAKRVLRRLGDG